MSLHQATAYYCDECTTTVTVIGTATECPNAAYHVPGLSVPQPDGTVL